MTPEEFALGPDEVILWEQGHPVCPLAWVCKRDGRVVRQVSAAEMDGLSRKRVLRSLGTPEEAGLPLATYYVSFVYVLAQGRTGVDVSNFSDEEPPYKLPSYRPCTLCRPAVHCTSGTAAEPCWGDVKVVSDFRDDGQVHACEGHACRVYQVTDRAEDCPA